MCLAQTWHTRRVPFTDLGVPGRAASAVSGCRAERFSHTAVLAESTYSDRALFPVRNL